MTTMNSYPSAGQALVSPWTNGSGTYPTSMGDASDATYISAVSSAGVMTPTWTIKCQGWNPYATDWIYTTTVTVRMRLSAGGSGSIGFLLGNMDATGSKFTTGATVSTTLTGDATYHDYTFTMPNHYYWKYADGSGVFQPAIQVRGGVGLWTGTLDVSAVLFTFTSLPYYTYSFTQPTSTITTTQMPLLFTATGSSGDGSALRHQYAVYSSNVYGAGGFDPQASIGSAAATGYISGSGYNATIAVNLVSGWYYRVYVWEVVPGSSGYVGTPQYQQTLIGVTAPPPPELVSLAYGSETGLTVTAYVTPRHNLLTQNQSDVETDTTGFGVGVNCTLARSAPAYVGTYSLAMTSVAAGDMSATTTPFGVGGVMVAAGKPYSATVMLRAGGFNRTCFLVITWFNSGGGVISSSSSASALDSSSSWTNYTVTATAPTGAVYAGIYVSVAATGGAGEVHYADCWGFHRGSTPAWSTGGMLVQTTGNGYEVGWDRSLDGGTTWTPVRPSPQQYQTKALSGGMWEAWTAQSAQMYDQDCPRGLTVTYRWWGGGTLNGAPVRGYNTGPGTLAVPNDGQWWVRSDLYTVTQVRAKRGSVSWTREEDAGVFRPFGRSTAVVVSGDMEGEDGSLTLTVLSAAEWAAVQVLLKSQAPLGLYDADGSFKWVRILPGGRSWVRKGGGSQAAWREVTVSYVEVDFAL